MFLVPPSIAAGLDFAHDRASAPLESSHGSVCIGFLWAGCYDGVTDLPFI